MAAVEGVEITGPRGDRYDEVLTPDALRLLASLQRELGPTRAQLLAALQQLLAPPVVRAVQRLDEPERTLGENLVVPLVHRAGDVDGHVSLP